MNIYKRIIIYIACFFYLLGYSFAQPVVINQRSILINIGKSISVLEDKSGKLTIDEVISTDYNSLFTNTNQVIPNLGFTNSTYWVRFELINKSKEDIFLKVSNSNLEKFDLYKIKNNDVLSKFESGCLLPFENRLIKSNQYYFPVSSKEENDETTIYLRLHYERGLQFPISIGSLSAMLEYAHKTDFIQGIYFGIMILMIVYNLILFFSIRDRSYLFYVFYVFSMGLLNAVINGYAFEYLWPELPELNKYGDIASCLAGISGIFFATHFLSTYKYTPRLHNYFKWILLIYLLILPVIFSGEYLIGNILIEFVSLILILLFFVTAIIVIRKGYKPAKFFLIAWSMLLISVVIFIMKDFHLFPNNLVTEYSMQFGSAIEAALLSLALANKINVYKEEKEAAQKKHLEALEANRKLILEQNIILEQRVENRTRELKETQIHLMRQEKLASLGQLTAGIAHEIKNPLNFVNNFSDVSGELVEELKSSKNEIERKEILNNLKKNLLKISHHGKRADDIIENMLRHSSSNPDEKRLTDINKLCYEYLMLSYNGMQVTFPDFKCELIIQTDNSIPSIKVAPFDFGRVILNLFNNSFYAVHEKMTTDNNYNPIVTLITKREKERILLSVIDNGVGIPDGIQDKIFNPFFTTKPTGKGTGLGLSLSYEIVSANNGEIEYKKTVEGLTQFIIALPVLSSNEP